MIAHAVYALYSSEVSGLKEFHLRPYLLLPVGTAGEKMETSLGQWWASMEVSPFVPRCME